MQKIQFFIFTLVLLLPNFIFGDIWDVDEATIIALKGYSEDYIRVVTFSLDSALLVIADEDDLIRVWDIKNGKCISTLKGSSKKIESLAISPDKRFLASGQVNGIIRIWDICQEKCVQKLKKHKSTVNSICFTPDGTILAAGSQDLTVTLWNTKEWNCIKTLPHFFGSANSIYNVQFSPDLQKLSVAMCDRVVIWDLHTEKYFVLGGPQDPLGNNLVPVVTTCFSSNGQYLLSGSISYNGIKLWNLVNRQCIQTFENTVPTLDLKWLPDGKRFVQTSSHNICVWDSPSTKELERIHTQYTLLTSMIYNDGKNLAMAVICNDNSETIGIYYIKQKQEVQTNEPVSVESDQQGK